MKKRKMFLARMQNCISTEDGVFRIADNNLPSYDGEHMVSWHPEDQFCTVHRPEYLLEEKPEALLWIEASCHDLSTGQSDAAYSLCDSFTVEALMPILEEHLRGLLTGSHGLTNTKPENVALKLMITTRDPETITPQEWRRL